MINIGYRLRKCRSDKCISVRRVSTPGYDGEKINTLIIEPKECGRDLPCIVFFHGGGFLMSASDAHYRVAESMCAKRQDSYIADRRRFEEILRTEFRKKGGKLECEVPHYLVVGECPWLQSWFEDVTAEK